MKLTVNLEKDSYPIYIENNILSQAGDYIRKIYHGKRIMIISDDNVFPLYGDRLIHTLDSTYECHHLVLPHGESTKDFQTLPTVYKAMLEAKISVNAAVHLACAKNIITKVDLDGPVLCSEDPILGGAAFDEKIITVADAPGLGIQGIDPKYLTYID